MALSGYIVFDKTAYLDEMPIANKIAKHIGSNLLKNLAVSEICREFYLLKQEIYKIIHKYMPNGIAAFIKNKGLKKHHNY